MTSPDGLWRQRPFLKLFAATSISDVGSAVSPLALSFAILDATNSAISMALVLAAQSIPTIVLVLFGGVLADRIPRSRLIFVTNIGSFCTLTACGTLFITGHASLVAILLIAFVTGVLRAFNQPAMRGIVVNIVERRYIQKANAARTTVDNFAQVFGPVVAGFLVYGIGGGWALIFDGLTYLFAAFLFASLRVSGHTTGRAGIIEDLSEGWRLFISYRWVAYITLAFLFLNLISSGMWNVLGRVRAVETHTVQEWGIILGVRAAGMLLASIALYKLFIPCLLAFGQIAMAGAGLPFLALGISAPFWVLTVTAFIAGVSIGLSDLSWETSLQEHIPESSISRVTSFDQLGSFIAVPVGQLIAVPIFTSYGYGPTAFIAGVLTIIIALMPLLVRSVRTLPRPDRKGFTVGRN